MLALKGIVAALDKSRKHLVSSFAKIFSTLKSRKLNVRARAIIASGILSNADSV